MYEWRKMSDCERAEVLSYRKTHKLPWHAPPHFPEGENVYVLSAACFEHKPIMSTELRRVQFERTLLQRVIKHLDSQVCAWVVLPNHYHLLAKVDLEAFNPLIHKIHNRTATKWNMEDKREGRQVWYRFSDRKIRNERHYWATVNYIHANPVKHSYVKKADEWICTSYHGYLRKLGMERLIELWQAYPIDEYGKDWDCL